MTRPHPNRAAGHALVCPPCRRWDRRRRRYPGGITVHRRPVVPPRWAAERRALETILVPSVLLRWELATAGDDDLASDWPSLA